MIEPQLHCVNDELPSANLKAFEVIYCDDCNEMLKASYNEQMQVWVETSKGDFCINCFAIRCNTGETDGYGWEIKND